MKTPSHKLPAALKDPQSWISIIGVVTVIGLCAGAFEPLNMPVPTQAGSDPAALTAAKAHRHPAELVASNSR